MKGRSAWELPEEDPSTSAEDPQQTSAGGTNQAAHGTPREFRQRYNRRGYPINPESRAFGRTSRRAQNDVLSTVGICVGTLEDGRPVDAALALSIISKEDKDRIELIRKENETGLILSAATEGLLFLSIWCISSLRKRIQVDQSALQRL